MDLTLRRSGWRMSWKVRHCNGRTSTATKNSEKTLSSLSSNLFVKPRCVSLHIPRGSVQVLHDGTRNSHGSWGRCEVCFHKQEVEDVMSKNWELPWEYTKTHDASIKQWWSCFWGSKLSGTHRFHSNFPAWEENHPKNCKWPITQ